MRQYIEATEDEASPALGDEVVPAIAVAALAIRSLLEGMELPAGALHVGQELEYRRALKVGESLAAKAQVASVGERGGWSLAAFEITVEDEAGRPVLIGRSTLMASSSQ